MSRVFMHVPAPGWNEFPATIESKGELKDDKQLYRAERVSVVVCSKLFDFCDLEKNNCRFKDDVRELLHPY